MLKMYPISSMTSKLFSFYVKFTQQVLFLRVNNFQNLLHKYFYLLLWLADCFSWETFILFISLSKRKNHNCSSWVLSFCYNCYSTCSLQRCNLLTALISDLSLRTFNLTSSLKIYTFKTSIVYITQYVIHYEKTNRVYVFLFRLYYHYWFVYVQ